MTTFTYMPESERNHQPTNQPTIHTVFIPACVAVLCLFIRIIIIIFFFKFRKKNGKTETKQRQQPYDYMDIAILQFHFSYAEVLFHMHWELDGCLRVEAKTIGVALRWVEFSSESNWVDSWAKQSNRSNWTATIPFALCHTTKHMPFLYVYLYAFYISNHNQRCDVWLSLLLLLLLLSLSISVSLSLCVRVSVLSLFCSCCSTIFFEVSFRFLLVFCFCLSLCFVFVQFDGNFNYFKVTRKSTASQLYAVVEVKRFIRNTHTFWIWCARKDTSRLLIADFISFDLVLLRFYSFPFVSFRFVLQIVIYRFFFFIVC